MDICVDCDQHRNPQGITASSSHNGIQKKIKTNGSLPRENTRKDACDDEAKPTLLEEFDQNSLAICKTPRTRIKTCIMSCNGANRRGFTYELDKTDFQIDGSKQLEKTKANNNSSNGNENSSIQRIVFLDNLRKLRERITQLQYEENEIFQEMQQEDTRRTERSEEAAADAPSRSLRLDLLRANHQARLEHIICLKQDQIESFRALTGASLEMQEKIDMLNHALDHDRAIVEDLEFQYLEEESEWISKHENLLVQLRFQDKIISSIKTRCVALQQEVAISDSSRELVLDLLSTVHTLERKAECLKVIDRQIIAFCKKSSEKIRKNGCKKGLSPSLSFSEPVNDSTGYLLPESLNENTLNSSLESVFDVDCKICFSVQDTDSAMIQSASSFTEPDSIRSSPSSERGVIESVSNQEKRISDFRCNRLDTSSQSEMNGSYRRENKQLPNYQRPLTRYFASASFNFDLKYHIEQAGHQLLTCPYVQVDASTCKGYLHKLGATFKGWSRRWFVLNRVQQSFVYSIDNTQKRIRGGACFSAIQEVYLDHVSTSKWDKTNRTFVVKTKQRTFHLQAATNATARIWIDVLMTSALGNESSAIESIVE